LEQVESKKSLLKNTQINDYAHLIGHGHTANYLDPTKVTKYIASEPNVLMHPEIRKIANAAGFTESAGTLLILPYGAQETTLTISALDNGTPNSIDTIISILVLCTVPEPEQTLHSLVRDMLKPGGQLLFFEHVLSHRPDVARWQRFWTPVWGMFFDGCRLDRPTHEYVQKMHGVWREGKVWGIENEPEEHLFWHRIGRFVKL
jgi:SAM-dependent methyltransferase